MYNLAKISSKRNAPLDLNIQDTVSVINIAMHYVCVQLISVLIYITHTKIIIRKQKHPIFFNFYIF